MFSFSTAIVLFLVTLSFVGMFVNGQNVNLWYETGLYAKFSLDFCYFSANDSQTLPTLFSTLVDETIEDYLESAFDSVLGSAGFNVSLIAPDFISTTNQLDDTSSYSYRCYTYGMSLGNENETDTTSFASLYSDTDDLSLITLSETFGELMITESDGDLNDDFRMLIYGVNLLCNYQTNAEYCDTDNNNYEDISSLTQKSELYKQVTQGTLFYKADNDYENYEDDPKFVLGIRFIQMVVIEVDTNSYDVKCENGHDKIQDNLETYIGPNSDSVVGTTVSYCDPSRDTGNNTNKYLVQDGTYQIIWYNSTKFYMDYLNHGNFTTDYFGSTIDTWTSNIYTIQVFGTATITHTDDEEVISVYIGCQGAKTTICDVDEYFGTDTDDTGDASDDDSDDAHSSSTHLEIYVGIALLFMCNLLF